MGIDSIRSIVLVGAGKGGVGKSSTTCLMAHAFKELGLEVGILDADVYGPSIPKMLGFDSTRDEISLNESGNLIPLILQNISLISLSLFQNERPSVVRAPVANSLIDEMLFKANWGALDVLFIDLPPGTGDIHLTILQKVKASAAIVVTSPQEVSYLDAKKASQMFYSMGAPIGGIVENFSGISNSNGEILPLFSGNAGEKLQREFNVELLSKIPLNPTISSAFDRGENPLLHSDETKKIIMPFAKELRDWMWVGKNIPQNEDILCKWS